MNKYIILFVVALLCLVVVTHYFVQIDNGDSNNSTEVTDESNIPDVQDKFSWEATVDRSTCGTHLCGSNLVLTFNDRDFLINDYIEGDTIGGCDIPVTEEDVINNYGSGPSDIPSFDNFVSHYVCLQMGGGSLFYVLKGEVGYQVMYKSFGDFENIEPVKILGLP